MKTEQCADSECVNGKVERPHPDQARFPIKWWVDCPTCTPPPTDWKAIARAFGESLRIQGIQNSPLLRVAIKAYNEAVASNQAILETGEKK